MSLVRLPDASTPARSAFTGFRFPREVIVLAVRWYLRFGLSYRDVEELLAERGIEVDHVTAHRWVQRFSSLLVDAARFARHRVGDRWHVDETYMKVAGRWVYLYRAVDQFGQVIDVYASARRDGEAARRFFQHARSTTGMTASEVITDRADLPASSRPAVASRLAPRRAVREHRVEADHAQLKRRLRPMRGIKTMTGFRILAAGHAFVQNLRCGHYEIATDQPRTFGSLSRSANWPRQFERGVGRDARPPCTTFDQCHRPVLAAVNAAVMELGLVRQRRAIEGAAFDNVWRGD